MMRGRKDRAHQPGFPRALEVQGLDESITKGTDLMARIFLDGRSSVWLRAVPLITIVARMPVTWDDGAHPFSPRKYSQHRDAILTPFCSRTYSSRRETHVPEVRPSPTLSNFPWIPKSPLVCPVSRPGSPVTGFYIMGERGPHLDAFQIPELPSPDRRTNVAVSGFLTLPIAPEFPNELHVYSVMGLSTSHHRFCAILTFLAMFAWCHIHVIYLSEDITSLMPNVLD
jgi:hypothetical protein